MGFLEKCKDFVFSPPRVRTVGDIYTLRAPDLALNPLIGEGANAYTFKQFQTLPSVNMLSGNGRVPTNFMKPLGQNNLMALRPAGPKQDVIGIPIGETDLFTEPTEA